MGAVRTGEVKDGAAHWWRTAGRPDVILAAAFVVILLPSTLLALVQGEHRVSIPVLVAAAALFAVLHALSFIAMRFALVSFAAANAVMLALAVLPGADGVPAAVYPSSVAYLLCLAQVAIQRGRLFGVGALAVGVAGAAVITLMPTVELEPHTRWGLFVGLVALVTVAWAVGLLLRLRRQQAEERERARVHEAITAERMRINRDLHDVVAHSMTVMIAQADVARAQVLDDPDAGAAAMSVVAETGREALRGMRGIVGTDSDAPREPIPDLDVVLADVETVRSTETQVACVEEGERGLLDAAARIALRYAVREALTNAIRHTAPPRRIDVRMQWLSAHVEITVTDDGGSGPAPESPGTGIGLIGMVERVRSAGGEATAVPVEASGWTVRIELPLAGADGGREQRG